MSVLQMKRQKGFTLIELMIVIAIIAILAAIAIPAYNQYIIEANMTRVNTAYEGAISVAKSEMARRQAQNARGVTLTDPTEEQMLALFNPDNTKAPSGDAQFAAAAADGGVIGVSFTDEDEFEIERPAFEELPGQTATIDANGQVTRVTAGGS